MRQKESSTMKVVQNINVQSADARNLMMKIWNFAIVQNAMGTTNIVRTICLRMNM